VLVVLLDPVLNGMHGFSNVDLTIFTGDAVNTRCFKAEVILVRPKGTGSLSGLEACSLDIMSH
jgi:hypothetical protein